MEQTTPIIRLDHLSRIYSKGAVAVGLHKLSVSFHEGEFVAVTGSSGSGKSTLLNVLSCLDSYDDGDYFFKGESISYFAEADRAEFRKKNISFVFQDYFLIDSYTVYQNIELALIDSFTDKLQRKKRVLELIEMVGLKGHENHRAIKLSGGQKQRVSIARALAKDAPIIFADEPTGNLDSATGREILELMYKLCKGKLVIIVTHSFDELAPYATRKLRLADGEIAEDSVISPPLEVQPQKQLPVSTKRQTISDLIRIGWYNLKATPKKTLFSLGSLAVLSVVFIWVLLMLLSYNESGSHRSVGYNIGTEFYKYDLQVVKRSTADNAVFESSDINSLAAIEGVCAVFPYNNIIDCTGKMEINGFELGGFLRPSCAVDFSLYKGRMPEQANEIVITIPASRKYTEKDWIGMVTNLTLTYEISSSPFYSQYSEGISYEVTVCGVTVGNDSVFALTNDFFTRAIAEQKSEDVKSLSENGAVAILEVNADPKVVVRNITDAGYFVMYGYGFEKETDFSSIITIIMILGMLGVTAIAFRITNGSIRTVEQTKSRDYNIMRTTGLEDKFIKSVYYVEMLLMSFTGWLIGAVCSFLILIIYGFTITPDISYGFSLLGGFVGNILWIIPLSLLINLVVTMGNARRFNRFFYKQTVKESLNNA